MHARICCLHQRLKWPLRQSACPAAFSGAEIGVNLTVIQTHRALLLSKLQNFVTVYQEACIWQQLASSVSSLNIQNGVERSKIKSTGPKNAGHERGGKPPPNESTFSNVILVILGEN